MHSLSPAERENLPRSSNPLKWYPYSCSERGKVLGYYFWPKVELPQSYQSPEDLLSKGAQCAMSGWSYQLGCWPIHPPKTLSFTRALQIGLWLYGLWFYPRLLPQIAWPHPPSGTANCSRGFPHQSGVQFVCRGWRKLLGASQTEIILKLLSAFVILPKQPCTWLKLCCPKLRLEDQHMGNVNGLSQYFTILKF